MERRARQRKTFHSILNQVAADNARRLMERARTANRLAKSTKGRARRRAYQVKTDALISLSKNFPERMFINDDPHTPRFVLVRNVSALFGLHAPARYFVRSIK